MREGIVREFGMDMDTRLYFAWRPSKDLLSSTGNSAQCHVVAWMEGEFGEEWIHVHVRLSLLSTRNYHSIVNKVYPNTN